MQIVYTNFFEEFEAEWLAISGEFLEKGAEIRLRQNRQDFSFSL
jgi:hypothetical protein